MLERLTEQRHEKSWRWFRLGWYLNIALALFALFIALKYLHFLVFRHSESPTIDATIMMSTLLIAWVLLLGAGISRYQARLESQNLELKLAMNRLGEKLDSLQALIDREEKTKQ